MPFANIVDVTITQTTPANNKSYTFSSYKFAQFSKW
eukprot:gene5497-13353_t